MSQQLVMDRYLVQRVTIDLDYVTRSVCIDTKLGREVLLTQLQGRTGRQAAVQERFKSEARVAARLSHAHIVALYDVDSWNGLPITIQEHAQSETLRDVINHEGPFHPDDVGVLVEHIAEALDFADQRGVHHLALRPEAVLIDYDGQALVTDFGIGHVLDDLAGPSSATAPYRSPERLIAGTGAGHRADIFALGVIAYEMLAGRLPLYADTIEQHIPQAAADIPPAPSAVRPEVPPAVWPIVLKAIAHNPADRYPTAAAFAYALVNWRDEAPVSRSARHQSPGQASVLGATETMPAVSIAPTTAENDAPRSWRTAILAWAAVAIGVAALLWAGLELLDRDESTSPTPPTRIAFVLPTATTVAQSTNTAVPEPAMVPTAVSLIGNTLEQAQALSDAPIRADGEEASDTAAAGQIIRQAPEPGQPLVTGEIVVVLSSGPAPLELADFDLDGMAFEDAAQELTSAGINVLRTDEGSETVPEGRVIRVDETSANPGDTVQVVVSMGNRIQIPQDLLGRPVDEAVSELVDLGFVVGEPVGVPRDRIESAGLEMAAFGIEDRDVVGIQEEDAGFGLWIPADSPVTPVFFDESL